MDLLWDKWKIFIPFLDFEIWRQFKYLRVALYGNNNSELAKNVPSPSAKHMDHWLTRRASWDDVDKERINKFSVIYTEKADIKCSSWREVQWWSSRRVFAHHPIWPNFCRAHLMGVCNLVSSPSKSRAASQTMSQPDTAHDIISIWPLRPTDGDSCTHIRVKLMRAQTEMV